MNMEKPTKEQMEMYEKIRYSGVTNMFDVRTVCSLSNGLLTEPVCFYIMHGTNYSDCMEEYGITRKN